ncbi:MAG: DUF58 domain-containing protein, partial [Deltaproteobacteria bacterium]|nr:DUF58 domain-containing protein [Deltaproteobacteria bacterium]
MHDENHGIVARVAELVARRGDAARLDATPRGRVRTLHAGAYASAHRGRGMEFDETRQYQAGDDVRAIDWRVTARTGRVHTKLFHEERERPVLLLVDQRPHMRFGTRDAFKSVVAARAAATVAWAARDRGDRVGGLILGAGALRHGLHAPQRSRARLLHLLSALSDATSHECAGTGSERSPHTLADALALLARTSRPGTLLWIISDFVDLDDAAARELARLARRCQVACVLVHDALETALPAADACRVSDGSRVLELPTASRRARDEYAARFAARRARLETSCRERGMGFVALRTGDDVTALLR